MPTHTLSDGTKLRTGSTRALVTFAISDDSQAHVLARTDDYRTAEKNHTKAERRGYCRVVTVSFVHNVSTGEKSRVRYDSDGVSPVPR